MMQRLGTVLLVAVLLTGCAGIHGEGRVLGTDRPEVGEQMMFVDRLAVADRDELARIGSKLRSRAEADAGVTALLRYALWLATPGHDGHDPRAARRHLEAILVEGRELDRPVRALVRNQLRVMRSREELLQTNARLTRENERLRAQIRALTELERRMGTDER